MNAFKPRYCVLGPEDFVTEDSSSTPFDADEWATAKTISVDTIPCGRCGKGIHSAVRCCISTSCYERICDNCHKKGYDKCATCVHKKDQ